MQTMPMQTVLRQRYSTIDVEESDLETQVQQSWEVDLCSRLMLEADTLPRFDETMRLEPPLRPPPNVFLLPRCATDPPLPWSVGRGHARRAKTVVRRKATAPKRRSMLPLLVLAMAAAISLGLACDARARGDVVSLLAKVSAARSFVLARH